MPTNIRPGAVIFTGDTSRLSEFYEAVAGLAVRFSDDGLTVLGSDSFELVIHSLAAEPAVIAPPIARQDSYIKPFFAVPSLSATRERAAALGGQLRPRTEEWEARGFRACEAIDPDGNVIQFREDAASSAAAPLGDGPGEVRVTTAEISGISPFFIVRNVPSSLSFYRDRLGFEVTYQGPAPDDIFFGIVRRDGAQILLKDVGVAPLPNYKRDVKQGFARWDAFVAVPDPDALAAEFASRNVEFSEPLKDTDDGLRGFELEDADGYVLFFGRPR